MNRAPVYDTRDTLEQKLREAEETIRRQAIELDNLREAWAFYEQVELPGEVDFRDIAKRPEFWEATRKLLMGDANK